MDDTHQQTAAIMHTLMEHEPHRIGMVVHCHCSEYESWRGYEIADTAHRAHVATEILNALEGIR